MHKQDNSTPKPCTIRRDHPLFITWALRHSDTVTEAIAVLHGTTEPVAIDGLVDVLCDPPSARVAVLALAALKNAPCRLRVEVLTLALDSPHRSVRLAAVQALAEQEVALVVTELVHVLCHDVSWLVRRAAVRALAVLAEPDRWRILDARDDPHWRVRHALAMILLSWGQSEEERGDILKNLVEVNNPRCRGLENYLRFRWFGTEPVKLDTPPPVPKVLASVWDWDPAVLLAKLRRSESTSGWVAVPLLTDEDERIRQWATGVLRKYGEAEHVAAAVDLLMESRTEACVAVHDLLPYVDLDRREEAARYILHLEQATEMQLAWAIEQAGEVFPIAEEWDRLAGLLRSVKIQKMRVRCALARLAVCCAREDLDASLHVEFFEDEPPVQIAWLQAVNARQGNLDISPTWNELLTSPVAQVRAEAVTAAIRHGVDWQLLAPLVHDPNVRVRLRLAPAAGARMQLDGHPLVRAAALTDKRARALMAEPTQETSWYVLAEAAKKMRVPLWELEPEQPWQPKLAATVAEERIFLQQSRTAPTCPFGPNNIIVSRMVISGAYGLPVEGFAQAFDMGVNIFFWEPTYQNLSTFCKRLSKTDRQQLHFIAGTFEGEGKCIGRDVERALRNLRLDCVSLFQLFWARSVARFADDIRNVLDKFRQQGKIAAYGLSTHDRELALMALDAGWNPVMIRHNAAHRGAEQEIFPKATALGTSIITFNNTCYGRLLALGESDKSSQLMSFTHAQKQVPAPPCNSSSRRGLLPLHSSTTGCLRMHFRPRNDLTT